MAILGIIKHSKVPLRIVTFIGIIASFMSLLVAIVFLFYKILFWSSFEVGIAPLIIGLFSLASIQIFLLGLIGIAAAWIREEKILVVLPLIFLANNIDSKKVSNFWLFLLHFFKKNYKQVIFYWIIVII